ncbi:PTS system mannose/fructose/N-acetylgalactosamine-transporter subunit IIB [Breznakia pachnodae]|uniref:PTS system mannose-specific IIB component n=1 Tax=Breznakia pachnodae TaxID=265178 RepID=A0ABU0E180_9FIRM|nr:PTS sugar transporter subunit IIB [Breznakia pachnodae]MDQ0360570.1 PTS system mannose-specific IIB component [Breznakia pachnodae]
MSIILGRIDYRLLHGIVSTMWAPQSGAQRIMVIDDRTANDPIIKESMRLGKPAGMACSIITEETAINNFKNGKYDDHKVFVVCENPETILKLQEEGNQKIPNLVIGITRDRVTGTKVSSRAAIKDEDKSIYKKIIANGTKVDVRFTTTDKAVPLANIMDL